MVSSPTAVKRLAALFMAAHFYLMFTGRLKGDSFPLPPMNQYPEIRDNMFFSWFCSSWRSLPIFPTTKLIILSIHHIMSFSGNKNMEFGLSLFGCWQLNKILSSIFRLLKGSLGNHIFNKAYKRRHKLWRSRVPWSWCAGVEQENICLLLSSLATRITVIVVKA